jgi:hypothetical protein
MHEDDAALNQIAGLVKNLFAIFLAILDVALIYYTLMNHIPALEDAVIFSFPQVLLEPGLWTVAAETLFCCAILVTVYGLITVWLPEMFFILWAGAGLAILAGLVYLVAAVTFYQSQGMGAPIQQGGFMFLISLTFPLLVLRLLRRMKLRRMTTQNQATSMPETMGEELHMGETASSLSLEHSAG